MPLVGEALNSAVGRAGPVVIVMTADGLSLFPFLSSTLADQFQDVAAPGRLETGSEKVYVPSRLLVRSPLVAPPALCMSHCRFLLSLKSMTSEKIIMWIISVVKNVLSSVEKSAFFERMNPSPAGGPEVTVTKLTFVLVFDPCALVAVNATVKVPATVYV